jgi:hypothetical protein
MFGFGGLTFKPDTDIPDLSGKVVLVTGGATLATFYLRTALTDVE